MREAPLLRVQLARLLLVPLLALLTADAVISYYVANRFAQDAYDKALVEVARELSLVVKADGNALRLDLPAAARRILLEDPRDSVYYELADREGRKMNGEDIAARRGHGVNQESYQTASAGGMSGGEHSSTRSG